jgi:hypothetical protein
MNKNVFLYFIGMALLTSCANPPGTTATATVSIPSPTPENYALYTDSDLQIYADMIDRRIQDALKSNNTSLAQELGRKRQELIAEFNRRGLKRNYYEPTRRYRYSRPAYHPAVGLPGEN